MDTHEPESVFDQFQEEESAQDQLTPLTPLLSESPSPLSSKSSEASASASASATTIILPRFMGLEQIRALLENARQVDQVDQGYYEKMHSTLCERLKDDAITMTFQMLRRTVNLMRTNRKRIGVQQGCIQALANYLINFGDPEMVLHFQGDIATVLAVNEHPTHFDIQRQGLFILHECWNHIRTRWTPLGKRVDPQRSIILDKSLSTVIRATKMYQTNNQIKFLGIKLIHLLIHCRYLTYCDTLNAIEAAVCTMDIMKDSTVSEIREIQELGCQILKRISESGFTEIGLMGGCDAVLLIIQKFPKSAELHTLVAVTLQILMNASKETLEHVHHLNGFELAVQSMKDHPDHKRLQLEWLKFLAIRWECQEILESVGHAGAIECILNTITQVLRNPTKAEIDFRVIDIKPTVSDRELQNQAKYTLSTLVKGSPQNLQRLKDNHPDFETLLTDIVTI